MIDKTTESQLSFNSKKIEEKEEDDEIITILLIIESILLPVVCANNILLDLKVPIFLLNYFLNLHFLFSKENFFSLIIHSYVYSGKPTNSISSIFLKN